MNAQGAPDSYAELLTGFPASGDYLILARTAYTATAQARRAISEAHHTMALVRAQSNLEVTSPGEEALVQVSSSPDRYLEMISSTIHLEGLKKVVVDPAQVNERMVDLRMARVMVETLEERWTIPFDGQYFCCVFVGLPGLCVAAELWGGGNDEAPDTVNGPFDYCTVDFDPQMEADEFRLDVFDCADGFRMRTEQWRIPVGLVDHPRNVVDRYTQLRMAGCGIEEAWAGALV